MMVPNRFYQLPQARHSGDQIRPIYGVLLHNAPFAIAESIRLAEQRTIFFIYLANVME
jgi:hypothetical protein